MNNTTNDILLKAQSKQTPFYLYDLGVLEDTLTELKNANKYGYKLHYALKANTDNRVLELIKQSGAGADCVSGGEIEVALSAGFLPEDITLAGVGKSDAEITLAVKSGIGYYNIESLEEIAVVQDIAKSLEKQQQVCLRINPNIDAHTHDHITTGLEGDKFGIALHEIDEALLAINNRPNLLFVGVHFHVGSQIDDMVVFEKLAEKASDIVKNIEKTGTEVRVINIGGGLAIDYVSVKENTVPDFVGYFDAVHKHISVRDDQEIHFEFGRAIVANCGLLITKVLFNKKAGGKEVVIVDAGMTELMRPALYGAYHHIENISSTLPSEKYTIVGPICESTDTFAEDRELAETKRGDYLAIYSAGAYGQTMSSEYNHRKKADTHYLSDK